MEVVDPRVGVRLKIDATALTAALFPQTPANEDDRFENMFLGLDWSVEQVVAWLYSKQLGQLAGMICH